MMTREELIELLGSGDKIKAVISCENRQQSLIIGPMVEEIYGVTKTDWEMEGDYWKYIFLENSHVNAHSPGILGEKFKSAKKISCDEFLAIVEGVRYDVNVNDLL